MAFINFNGKIFAQEAVAFPFSNSAFRYGAGLIETILVKDNCLQLEALHWARLWLGMQQLNFPISKQLTPARLTTEVLKTVAKNNLTKLSRVRLQMFVLQQGLYETYGELLFIIECFALNEAVLSLNENGLVCGIANGFFKSNDSLANLKSSNMLLYQQAAHIAQQQKWNDVLIINEAGNIIESAIANIFWVKEEQIFTPPLSEGCVAGVMRQQLINSCTQNFIIEEKPLTPSDLKTADEVFLTNAIRGVKWVQQIEDCHYELNIAKKIATNYST